MKIQYSYLEKRYWALFSEKDKFSGTLGMMIWTRKVVPLYIIWWLNVYTSEVNGWAKQFTLCMNAVYKARICRLHSLRSSETVQSYLFTFSNMNIILQHNCKPTAVALSTLKCFFSLSPAQKNGTCSDIITLLKLHPSKY